MSAAVESLFYTREKPWHGLGVRVEESPTSEDAIVAAGLDWIVEKKPIFDANGNQINNYFANTRNTDQSVLGIVSGRYEIIQNKDAFSFTDSLVDEGLTYECAGSLRDGKQIFLLAHMPQTKILGEALEPYICFTNTFDGSGAVQCICTPTRIVCMNTLNFALKTAKRKWSTKHIGDIQSKLYEARMTLGLANQYIENLQIEAERLASVKVSDEQVEAMLDLIYPIKDGDSDIRKKRVERLKDGFFTCLQAPDIKQYKNTAYAVAMAATDYADHSEPFRKTANFESNRWATIMQGHPFVDAIYAQLAA